VLDRQRFGELLLMPLYEWESVLLERDDGPGLADDESCCCVDVECCDPPPPRRLKADLDATNCSCLEGVRIVLTYGTRFCGSIDAPEGTQTPPGWETGVVGWEGSVTTECDTGSGSGGGGRTAKQRVWCWNGLWHSVFYIDDVPVSGFINPLSIVCCPFDATFNHGISSLVATGCEGPVAQVSIRVTPCA
jgi:hypothetical protein